MATRSLSSGPLTVGSRVRLTDAYLDEALTRPVIGTVMDIFPRPDWGSQTAWGVVLYQAFLGAIAHVWWYEGVKAVGPSRAAIFMNLQPVVGVVLAWALLHEAVEWPEVVGGPLVLLGVALTTQAPLASREAS